LLEITTGQKLASPVVARRQAGFATEDLRKMAWAGIANGHADLDDARIRLLQEKLRSGNALANEVA
jgi:hypothetical protein